MLDYKEQHIIKTTESYSIIVEAESFASNSHPNKRIIVKDNKDKVILNISLTSGIMRRLKCALECTENFRYIE